MDLTRHLEHSTQKQKNHGFLKGTWSVPQICHILGHKTFLNKFKETEVIPTTMERNQKSKTKGKLENSQTEEIKKPVPE